MEKIFLDLKVNGQNFPFICRNNFEKNFVKAIESFFPYFFFYLNTRGLGKIRDSYANPPLHLGFA